MALFASFAAPRVAIADDEVDRELIGMEHVLRLQMVEKARREGCHIHVDEGERYAAGLNMSRHEMKNVARVMIAKGEATADGPIMTLSAELCGKAPTPLDPAETEEDMSGNPMGLPGGPSPMNEPREAFVAFMGKIGCVLDWDSAEEALSEAGFDYVIMEVLIRDYVEEQIVIDDGTTLFAAAGECAS